MTISLADYFTLAGSIPNPPASNLASVARLFHTTTIKSDQKERERERESSQNQHPSWSDEKSTAHLCVWRSFTLAATNPELCIHSVCDTKPNRTLTRQCYIIKLGKRLQQSASAIPVAVSWYPTPELSTTGGQYVNPTSVTH